MRGISVELKTIWSRLEKRQIGGQGELKREAWFDEVRPLRDKALKYADRIYMEDPETTTTLMTEIDQTTTELWKSVSFRSPEEISGKSCWSVAPRKPAATVASGPPTPVEDYGRPNEDLDMLIEALRRSQNLPASPARCRGSQITS